MNRNNIKIILTLLGVAGIVAIIAVFYSFSNFTHFFSNLNTVVYNKEQHIDESLFQHSYIEETAIAGQQDQNKYIPAVLVSECFLKVRVFKTNPTVDTTTYSIEIKNEGAQICQNASISTYYASEENFISATPKPIVSNYYWVLGQLESDSAVNIALTTNKKASNMEQTEGCATADNARQDACVLYEGESLPLNDFVQKPPLIEFPPIVPISLNNKENGVWVWKSPLEIDQTYRDFIFLTAEQNNFNVIYITIDDYLDIAFLPDGVMKNERKNKYMDALELFVEQANQKGIAIDAEAGWKDWAEPENTYKPFAIVDFIKEYNATREHKLRGLQYDVEPYLMLSYEKNKAALLKNFVALIDQTVDKLEGINIMFNIVIPHFYDENQKWTPSFSYNKKNTFTFNHLLGILERRPGSAIILMAYRNFASGKNSTIEISKAEIEKATNGGYKTQIIIAQETGSVVPDYVTFFGTSKNYFNEQVNIIKETFFPYKNFGGISTHYIDPFLELE